MFAPGGALRVRCAAGVRDRTIPDVVGPSELSYVRSLLASPTVFDCWVHEYLDQDPLRERLSLLGQRQPRPQCRWHASSTAHAHHGRAQKLVTEEVSQSMAQSASRAEVSSKRVFGIRTRPRTDYVLSTAGTVALLALAYYLLKHGLNLTDGVRLLLFSLPVALAAVAGLLFSSLLLPPRRKPLIVVLAVVAIIGVYATDFLLGSASPAWSGAPMWNFDRSSPRARQEVAALARSFGVEIDSRDRDERLQAFKSRGVDAVPALMLADILTSDRSLRTWHSGDGQEMLPLGGISGAFTVLCNEAGPFVTYTSDEHGFRNPSGNVTSTRAGLAALGQSLTQGYCVSDGTAFVDLLRPQYPITLNLGMSGQSSLLQLAAIKEYLQALRPRNVLWFYTEGIDLPDLYEESTQPWLMRYLGPTFTQKLVNRQSEMDTAVQRFQSGRVAPPP